MFFKKSGIHPDDSKLTRRKKSETLKIPKKVVIPLAQHIGKQADPCVAIGDIVKTGQIIGKSDAFVSSNIHASISGKITEIAPHLTSRGCKLLSVVIESDEKDDWIELKPPKGKDNKEKISFLKESGLVGMGGATFPTHVKVSPPPDKKIEHIIINGAECEPYLNNDNRLMIEKPEIIFKGIKKVIELTGCKKITIGVEENKPNAIRKLQKIKKSKFDDLDVTVVKLPRIYPQGAEKVLIKQITDKWVPAGGLPLDIGCLVLNVFTLKSIYEAIELGKPVTEAAVTVTGAVKEPKNLIVRIGTPVNELIEFCGGYVGNPKKLIIGGPMMGTSQYSDEIPVVKGMGGVIAISDIDLIEYDESPCIKCSKCVDACPMNLMPLFISKLSKKGKFEACESFNAMDCFECGCCAYGCPCKIPLVQLIKVAKSEIIKKRNNKEK